MTAVSCFQRYQTGQTAATQTANSGAMVSTPFVARHASFVSVRLCACMCVCVWILCSTQTFYAPPTRFNLV